MSLRDYLKLLDWTARQCATGKRGKISKSLRTILERLGIESNMLADLVWGFAKYFGCSRAAGSPNSLREEAKNSYRHWRISCQRLASECFS
ncbi:MAG: hypothetical protein AAF483_01675 [Planctomycetota bacterium]